MLEFSIPTPGVGHNYLESCMLGKHGVFMALFTLGGRYLGLVGHGPTREVALSNVLGGVHRRIVENGGYYKGATEPPCHHQYKWVALGG